MAFSTLRITSIASAALLALASAAHGQMAASAPDGHASMAKPMHGKKHGEKMQDSTDKAGKPSVDGAASQPTAKKPAKAGAQSGPASAPKP